MDDTATMLPLELRPDFEEVAKRWEAYWAGEMLERPIVLVSAPQPGREHLPIHGYREMAFGDIDEIVRKARHNAAGAVYGGESLPGFYPSFGPDELSVFCGGEFVWGEGEAAHTNWTNRVVDDWDTFLPLGIQEDHPLWLRMQELVRKAAEGLRGRALVTPLDFHSNMDLLLSLRGSQRLCLDMLERPDAIDRAMEGARRVFPQVWNRLRELAGWDRTGVLGHGYGRDGCCTLQCDFICMMSPDQFRRWTLPALEEEGALVRNVVFHWDGPGALIHKDDLCAASWLHTFAYVPTPGKSHMDHLDLYKEVQKRGKGVAVGGSPDEIKLMSRELQPHRTIYGTGVGSVAEMEDLLEWFRRNT